MYDQFDCEDLLPKYAQLYVKELIFYWKTCDWFCVRVLGPTIAKNGLPCAESITSWNRADNLWQARSSIVAFMPVSADSQYYPLIYKSCHWLIQREERFAKTGVGWILRDLTKYDKAEVLEFVVRHLANFSVEAVKNALKYFSEDQRKMVVEKLKQT